MGAIAAQVELGALVGMRNLVEGPVTSLTELYELGMRFTVGWPAFIPRVVALAFDVLGDDAASDDWFDRALDDAQRSAATAEIARTALDHARVLEARAGARGLVADRRELARQTYAQLSIRPRVGGAEVLSTGATSRQVVGSDVTRIVLVTDLVSSTMLNDALGDREYLELLRKHDELVRRHLVECDGVEFKHTGDGIAAWFLSVNNALRCAEALRSDFHVRSADLAAPLELRIALTAGAPTLVDGDLLGITVTLAFRIVDLAEAGDVLLTSDVAGLARGLGWSFERHGTHHVKGVHDAIEVLRVRPSTRT
jgi:class 3 adenylate cyclase